MTPATPSSAPIPFTTKDRSIPGPHGDVLTRFYLPSVPVGVGLVWLHGGGFCMNDLDVPEGDGVARLLAAAGIVVVNVDYRLAVDGVHFPVPGDDVRAAWLDAVVSELGGVPADRWHVGGGSAGGNLAAVTCLRMRDEGGPLPASAILVYPVLHDVIPPAPADLLARMDEIPEEARFTPELCDELNLNYVGDASLCAHPYAFPAHGDVTGFPPALVITSELDTLRPSGQAFAADLASAGVDLRLVREPNALHGHLNRLETPEALRTVARIIDWLTAE
ncbi:alpha/beta hydrolase [Actinomyces culturomici]|uniref:alpha/beta hydrolase n=1 Tax=Actinomyces culturomici TaxID=1926276 RepID=UPI000E20187B|nr:alpha/beta hydrolase [Actinomyces culturomici]